ncbi:GNAT family N-acetyltransferase [Paenibacillus sp. PR3]|uniref:GNAT family N-acetyltransferase n=1 Tax=Paenibacillus terricola TaxID=2763503 RepID=A0ABR8MR59_9BACL|nr:GNAT family N-acetyltransferase [Paenibacillus terricola]MBD3918477.1 GNAT family N-acetyltransferase [Paenibacillus terricola]
MLIIQPLHDDIQTIRNIFASCRRDLSAQNIHQWDDQYPNIEVIRDDIHNETIYAAVVDDRIAGVISFDDQEMDEYTTVDWSMNDGKYLIVHRLAVHPEFQRLGIAKRLMDFVHETCIKQQIQSVRLDVYSGNPHAVAFYERLGYEHRGQVMFPRRIQPFYCMEKVLR